MGPQPPPVAPRTGAAKVTVQAWQSSAPPKIVDPSGDEPSGYGHHVRCGSMDSVDSNSGSSVSSTSSTGSVSHTRQLSNEGEFLPTRSVVKQPSLPSHNPLQFVKVNSPLYKKAEHQIKLAKEVKITKEALKESEEEWQSNLDNWKSRRRKASEKVIQRAEEMRQIEAEEQLRQLKDQQRKIKTFSEMVEKRTNKRSYNLDLYISHGDDSGVGGTPEPDEQDGILDSQQSNIRSDTSEGMTSETDSIDSDAHISDKTIKEPPKVPKKPHSWLARKNSSDLLLQQTALQNKSSHLSYLANDNANSENASSAEPSDVEGHAADTETASSEDDAGFCGTGANVDSGLESLCDNNRTNDTADSASDLSQDSTSGMDKPTHDNEPEFVTEKPRRRGQLSKEKSLQYDEPECEKDGIQILITTKHGQEAKGFGFTFRGGRNEGAEVVVDSVAPGGSADHAGLKIGDKILRMNGEPTASYSHSSLLFSVKQASYTGQLDLLVHRPSDQGVPIKEKQRFDKKAASFAEKLAMFSGGSPEISLPKSSQGSIGSSKEEELKRESLVLRRRTTFEKSSAEKEEAKSRRSSCVSPETTSKSILEERRHSVDFSKPVKKSPDEGFSAKKPPPPPVPAKPKVKPKTYQAPVAFNSQDSAPSLDSVSEAVSLRNLRNENFYHDNDVDDNYTIIYSSRAADSENSTYQDHSATSINSTADSNDYYLSTRTPPPVTEVNSSPTEGMPDFDTLARKEIADLRRLSLEEISATAANLHQSDTDEGTNIHVPCSSVDDVNNEHVPCEYSLEEPMHDVETHERNSPRQSQEEAALFDEAETEPEKEENYKSEMYLDESIPEDDRNSQSLHLEDTSVDFSEKEESAESCTVDTDEQSSSNERPFADEVTDSEISSVSREDFVQINMHPLGRPLEKIDEDDIASGSTNTSSSSSDTPDTETVIDIFPSDIPQLPAETCSDDISHDDKETQEYSAYQPEEEQPQLQPEDADLPLEAPQTEEEEEEQEFPSSAQVELLEPSPVNVAQVYEQEELCENELEESADQLSPLDVIDQIEQKLMQQLEQQALEDLTEDSNGHLEEEVSRELLYLSDDADLIEDFDVPRNVVPPSEPPPPPPPEPEKIDAKANPFQRVNSTKRIKKEIWRRRSDFLGLESSAGLNVDDLPPPPPGLEELLKSEMELQREQRLFMEKRLSLADSDYASATDTLNSATESTSTFSPSKEYTSEYMMEVLDAEVFDAVTTDYPQSESWKVEECHSPNLDSRTHDTSMEKENNKNSESPQQKAKNHIHSLGAAPRAKIMDSNKWITQAEKHTPLSKRVTVDPLFRDGSYTQNFWVAQEADRRSSSVETSRTGVDRRYSLPPVYGSKGPDVTVRTWSDREFEYQLQSRPKSGAWSSSSVAQQYTSHTYPDYYNNGSSSWNETKNGIEEEEREQYEISHQCSYCGEALTEGSAMGIDALQLYFHIECFCCCQCRVQLGNGSCGTDVQVKNSQLYCPKCFALD